MFMQTSRKKSDTMETFQMCAFWIAKRTLAKFYIVHLSFVILFFSAASFVDGQAYLVNDSVTLPCTSSSIIEGDNFAWIDVSRTITIYSISAGGQSNKQPVARQDQKYDNFDVENNYPNSVNMKINSLDFSDGGIYRCEVLEKPPDIEIIVEALPDPPVSIQCQSADACSPSSNASSEFSCTCSAIGAYPGDLQFEWSDNTVVLGTTDNVPSSNKERPEAFDFTGEATFTPTVDLDRVTCTLVGYNGTTYPVDDRSDTYTFAPPGKCDITISCNDEATVATLTCSCQSGMPENTTYTYYDQDNNIITSEYPVLPGVEFTVGCRGCNGYNYGEDTFISELATCIPSTTALPTTTVTTEITSTTPVPTGGEPRLGLIIGLICVGLIVICAGGGVAFYCIKRDGKGCSSNSHSPANEGGIVTPLSVSTTSSSAPLYGEVKKDKKKKSSRPDDTNTTSSTAPLYGEVKKDRKKKSNKPDGNGAGPENDPPTYAAVDKPQPTAAPRTSQKGPEPDGMELQYADLDHTGKPATSEIRKPQDEPTEYATVQSVIV